MRVADPAILIVDSGPASRAMTFLALSNVSKAYGRTQALSEASIDIAHGEVHALMGENGAGKSTLIKVLAGIVSADNCRIEIDGAHAMLRNAQDAFALGFRFIHQELNIVPHLSVAENMSLATPYPIRFGFSVDWKRLNDNALAALKRLGVDHIDPGMKIARLSPGDQMLVKIASALSDTGENPARLFVMDEPTASLTGDESERLFAVIDELKRSGASTLYVSHRMDEVMRICDRVTVFRDGRHVATNPIDESSKSEVVRHMTGRDVADAYPQRASEISTEIACRARDLETARIAGISFELHRGEILGVAGLTEAGQNDVLKVLMGLDPVIGGSLKIGSHSKPMDPTTAWKNKVAYVPRERRREALMLRRSILENTVLPHLKQLSFGGGIVNRTAERKQAGTMSRVVRLKSDGLKQPCYQLSGGNQQKVVFARALGASPELLLLDEPTRGVDVGSKFDIYTLVRDLSSNGCAVVLTSSDLPELLGMCDRILIMRNGRQSEIVDTDGLDSADLLSRFYH